MELQDFLKSLPDSRRSQGKRHSQEVVLLMVIMAILSEKTGYRGYANFMEGNEKELNALFELKHGVPSHVTIRGLIQDMSIPVLTEKFMLWMQQYIDITDNEFISSDGKVMRSTVTNPNDSMQSFVSIVSLFGQKTGLSYGMLAFENGKSYEGHYVQKLIDLFKTKGIIIDLDALHCKKKHLKIS